MSIVIFFSIFCSGFLLKADRDQGPRPPITKRVATLSQQPPPGPRPASISSPPWVRFKLCLGFVWLMLCVGPDVLVACFRLLVPRRRKSVVGEVVMVTGSGQGLGRALSLKFAALGSHLVCVDIDEASNQETVRQIRQLGGDARGFVCNVADQTAVGRLAAQVGRVDVLVNNAGAYPNKGLWNATEHELRRVVDVNLMSQMWTVQAFLPGMTSRDHGHVVCMSSISALSGLPNVHPYAVAKAGLIGLMTTLRVELQQNGVNGVKLTTVLPYFINTRPEIGVLFEASGKVTVLETDAAVDEIFDGILRETASFSVPRSMARWYYFMNIMPERFTKRCDQLFFVKNPKSHAEDGRRSSRNHNSSPEH